MLGSERQVSGRDSSLTPVSLRRELLSFELTEGLDHHLHAFLVSSEDVLGSELVALLVLLVDAVELLLLDVYGSYLHAKNNVFNFTLSECCHVHVILLSVVSQDQIAQLHLYTYPLLIVQVGPDVSSFSHNCRVGSQHCSRSLLIDVERPKNKHKSREASKGLRRLLPVVVEVEEEHLWLGGFEDPISELLNFEASLEGQLQFRTFDYDVGEVEQVHFQRIQHAFPGHNDLLRLLFDREASDQSCYFFCALPLRKLAQSFLAGPDALVNYLQEKLSSPRVENEDRSVNRLCCQVALKGFVNHHAIHIGVINEPGVLVGEEFTIVLGVKVWLIWFRRIKLKSFPNSLSKYI